MDALPQEIGDKVDEVRALCAKHGVKRLELFGSAVKGGFTSDTSDVDFIVEFFPESDPVKHGRAYLDLWKALKQLFGREVDLVEVTTIDNPYFARAIEPSRIELYDAA